MIYEVVTKSYLCSDIEHLDAMKGDTLCTPTDNRGDLTADFVDVMKITDLPTKQVEDYSHIAHIPALEGLISSTSMQGAAVWKS